MVKGRKEGVTKDRSRTSRFKRRGRWKRTITIEVQGGVVSDVHHIPSGYDHEIIDHDIEESDAWQVSSP